MIRRPPRSTQSRSSAASDVYKRQENGGDMRAGAMALTHLGRLHLLRNEIGASAQYLKRAQQFTQEAGWLAFAAYPLSWVADFQSERVRVVEQLCCLVEAAFVQLDLRDPGKRVGRECEPACLLRELLGPLQILSRCPDFVPEQMESAEVGQRHGPRAHVSPVLGLSL